MVQPAGPGSLDLCHCLHPGQSNGQHDPVGDWRCSGRRLLCDKCPAARHVCWCVVLALKAASMCLFEPRWSSTQHRLEKHNGRLPWLFKCHLSYFASVLVITCNVLSWPLSFIAMPWGRGKIRAAAEPSRSTFAHEKHWDTPTCMHCNGHM